MKKKWYTYIVECRDGSYYTGTTNDLQRRLDMHNAGTASRYTRSRLPVRYRHVEAHSSQSKACKREAEIKKWPRSSKAALCRSPGKSVNLLAGLGTGKAAW